MPDSANVGESSTESCLVAMAGLPGTGKSTLAHALASQLGGVVLDKDVVRSGLFTPEKIEYSRQQDDFCMSVLFQTARYLIQQRKVPWVFIDGRTFGRSSQINQLAGEAASMGCRLKMILCQCSDASAEARLARQHMAANRDYALYQRLKKEFEPIALPHHVVNTDSPQPAIIASALGYLKRA